MQGLLQRGMGKSVQPGKSPCYQKNGGALRTYSIQKTSERFQRCSLLPLLLLFPLLSSPPPPKPHFSLLKSQKELARLVTKARGLRWPRVKRLFKRVLSPRIRVRRSDPRPRPMTPRMLHNQGCGLQGQGSQVQTQSKRPQGGPPSCQGIVIGALYFTSLYFFFFFFFSFLLLLLLLLLWQFTTVYNVPSFRSMKRL